MSFFNSAVVSSIINAATAEQKGVAALVAATDAQVQKALDILTVRCKVAKAEFMKGNAKTNEARREVGELFSKVGAAAGWGEHAIRNYQTSFWMAFKDGTAFDRCASMGDRKGSAKGAKAGGVTTTTMDSIVVTLKKAIQQATLMECDALAADLLRIGKKHVDADWSMPDTE